MSFDHAVIHVLEREGGYTTDPNDPGNWTGGTVGYGELRGTKYGISAKSFPHLDIPNLTIEQAKAIYKDNYWDKVRGDELPDPIAFCVFDCAVNQGVDRAIKFLQRTVGVVEDGVFGSVTKANALTIPPSRFVEKYQALRLVHYASLSTWKHYGEGWARRAIGVAVEAMK